MKRFLAAVALVAAFATSAGAQLGNTAIIISKTLAVDEATVVAESLRDISTFSVYIKNAGTYQAEFEGSFDAGATWVAVYGEANDGMSTQETTATGPDVWFFTNKGMSKFRVRLSAYTSGAPVVYITRGYAK